MNVAELSPRSKNVALSIKAEALAEILNIQTTVREVILQHSRQKNYISKSIQLAVQIFHWSFLQQKKIFKAGIIQ